MHTLTVACLLALPGAEALDTGLPPLSDLQRFPPTECVNASIGFALGCLASLKAQQAMYPHHCQHWQTVEAKGRGAAVPVGTAGRRQGAGREEEGGEGITDQDCREALGQLRELLGERADAAGLMALCVPTWRFRRVGY